MDRLLVETKELRPEYRERNRLWDKFYKRFCLTLALIWKSRPLIHYPLTIDIELGTMKYDYFKFGIEHTLRRIWRYNVIMGARLEGRNVDLDTKDFYIETLLTDEQAVEDQLNKELLEHYRNG
jgi:hypothetical protein